MEVCGFAENTGKRKSSFAKVMLIPSLGDKTIITINGEYFTDYLQDNPRTSKIVSSPLSLLGLERSYHLVAFVRGGGISGQADAIRLAVSRALVRFVKSEDQKKLKINGFLTRNSLCKERRKYGLKKARKAPQFSKR